MPNRIVREGILSSERVDLLTWEEEVFYRRLHSIVDDYGRHEALPMLLKAKCFPLRLDSIRTADISRWITACEKAGLLLGYEAGGKRYIQVIDFRQTVRSESKCPAPTDSQLRSSCTANAVVGVSASVSVIESAVVSAVGRTADSKKPEGKQRNDGTAAWREVFEVLCDILGSQDAIQVLEYYRKQHPDCPEPIQRNVIGWAIEAKKNAKTGVLKYMLNCKQTPSDAALEETKERLKKLRGAA